MPWEESTAGSIWGKCREIHITLAPARRSALERASERIAWPKPIPAPASTRNAAEKLTGRLLSPRALLAPSVDDVEGVLAKVRSRARPPHRTRAPCRPVFRHGMNDAAAEKQEAKTSRVGSVRLDKAPAERVVAALLGFEQAKSPGKIAVQVAGEVFGPHIA